MRQPKIIDYTFILIFYLNFRERRGHTRFDPIFGEKMINWNWTDALGSRTMGKDIYDGD